MALHHHHGRRRLRTPAMAFNTEQHYKDCSIACEGDHIRANILPEANGGPSPPELYRAFSPTFPPTRAYRRLILYSRLFRRPLNAAEPLAEEQVGGRA
jgi:hypothetical protein